MIEAAAYMLAKRRDPELERYVDDLIDKAVAGMDGRAAIRIASIRVSGNLLEAGVAYYRGNRQAEAARRGDQGGQRHGRRRTDPAGRPTSPATRD